MIVADTETLKEFKNNELFNYDRDVLNWETSSNYNGRRIWLISFSDGSIFDVYNSQRDLIPLLMKHPLIYFHNLSYDGNFIIKRLQFQGFKEKKLLSDWSNNDWYEVMMIGSKIYRIVIKYKSKRTTLLDSSNFIREKVANIPSKYGLKGLEKGWSQYKDDIDGYDKRWMYDIVINNKINEPLYNEFKEYCKNDAYIVSKALDVLQDFLKHNNINKDLKDYITVSSLAYDIYLDMNSYMEPYVKIKPELYKKYRSIYKGGFCDCNDDYVYKPIKNAISYDINSAYPAIVNNEKIPLSFTHDDGLDYVTTMYWIKINHCYAKTNLRFLFNDAYTTRLDTNSHPKGFAEYSQFFLYEKELKWVEKYYDIDYEIIEKRPMYGTYIDNGGYVKKFYSLKKQFKQEGNKGFETLSKLFLNSVTGKYGQRMEYKNRVIFTRDNEVDIYKLKHDGKRTKKEKQHIKTKLSNDNSFFIDKRYINELDVITDDVNNFFMVAYITSMTRCRIIEMIDEVGIDNWYYSDTDSIKIAKEVNNKNLVGLELGQFKNEGTAKEAWFYHPKAYCWDNEYTFAGLSKGVVKYEPKDIKPGLIIHKGKKRPENVRNGLELIDVDYIIGA